jgi:hypothetical protein
MRFECDFVDPDDRRQQVTIPVELTPGECRAIRALRREGDEHLWVKIQSFALRHAYRQAPEGFQHIQGGVRQLLVH